MKNLITILIILFIPILLSSQNKGGTSSSYQKDYHKINMILKKDISAVTQSDINTLKVYTGYPDNHYGELNSVNFKTLKKRINNKLTEYSGHSNLTNKYSSVSREKEKLDQQLIDSAAVIQALRDTLSQVRSRLYKLIKENDKLKLSIDEYKKQVSDLESTIEGLQKNWDYLDQIVSNLSFINNYRTEFDGPDFHNLLDSTRSVINKSTSAILGLMNSSLDHMLQSDSFLDSASTYFKDSTLHLPDLMLFKDKITSFSKLLDSNIMSKKIDKDVKTQFDSLKAKYNTLLAKIKYKANDSGDNFFSNALNAIGSFFSGVFADGLLFIIILAILIILLLIIVFLLSKQYLFFSYSLKDKNTSPVKIIAQDEGLKASKLSIPEESPLLDIIYPRFMNNVINILSKKQLYLKLIPKDNIEIISFSESISENKKVYLIPSGETTEIEFTDIENKKYMLQLDVYEENNNINENE